MSAWKSNPATDSAAPMIVEASARGRRYPNTLRASSESGSSDSARERSTRVGPITRPPTIAAARTPRAASVSHATFGSVAASRRAMHDPRQLLRHCDEPRAGPHEDAGVEHGDAAGLHRGERSVAPPE